MMDRAAHKKKLIEFLHTIRRPDRSLDTVDEKEGLIRSGLIDSLAILEIIEYLEQEYGVDFSARGVDPGEMGSLASILDLIERETA